MDMFFLMKWQEHKIKYTLLMSVQIMTFKTYMQITKQYFIFGSVRNMCLLMNEKYPPINHLNYFNDKPIKMKILNGMNLI